MARLRWRSPEAKWHGDNMNPWDGDWVAECRNRAVELQTWLCTSAEDDRELWNRNGTLLFVSGLLGARSAVLRHARRRRQ